MSSDRQDPGDSPVVIDVDAEGVTAPVEQGQPSTALARTETTALDGAPEVQLDGPAPAIRRAVHGMLEASVGAYGDVVQALIVDLDQASLGLSELSWLSSTQSVLADEGVYQAAVQQLQWWDRFLAGLPCPELLSERQRIEQRKVRALRARAVLHAREAALAEHRRRVEDELRAIEAEVDAGTRPELSEDEWDAWARLHDEPQDDEWRVDVGAMEAEAVAAWPDPDAAPPITVGDLDPNQSFGGFNAVSAMREHAELAQRAAWMDDAVVRVLQAELSLSPAAAERHARVLTGMFWIALRRALAKGSHELAAAIRMFADAGPGSAQGAVQEQFSRELLLSWMAYLEQIPAEDQARALGARVPLLGGLFRRKTPAALPGTDPQSAPRQLTDGRSEGSVWSRVKKGLGLEGE